MTDFITPVVTLNDGREMPKLGFGTFKIAEELANEMVAQAVQTGFELIDTAAIYGNEQGVGRALAGRTDTWITTKIWNESQGYAATLSAFEDSLSRLGRDSVDLLLIHWPCPAQDRFLDTWRAMVELREAGRARSIGVSNFRVEDLQKLADGSGTVPAVNQVELHPAFQQRELRDLHQQMGIVTQSWSPLGQGHALEHPAITDIAQDRGVSAAAIVLAWHLAHDLAPIPKAGSAAHMQANFAALSVSLSEDEIARIDALDEKKGRIGPDPATFC